jgi:hypothetical protein
LIAASADTTDSARAAEKFPPAAEKLRALI